MSNTKPEHYQAAYNKIYVFLRNNHPEILLEYQQACKRAKETAEAIMLLGEK